MTKGYDAIAAAIDRLTQAIVAAVVLDAARCKVAPDEVEKAVALAKQLMTGGKHEG